MPKRTSVHSPRGRDGISSFTARTCCAWRAAIRRCVPAADRSPSDRLETKSQCQSDRHRVRTALGARRVPLPVCVAGKSACPPEDVGGPHGYGEVLRALGLEQQSGPLRERRTPLLEVVVSVIGALDPAQRLPQAALGHFAPDTERGELGPRGAPQVGQPEGPQAVRHALQSYVQRIETDMRYALAGIAPALREQIFAAGREPLELPEPTDHLGHERNVEGGGRLGTGGGKMPDHRRR